MTFPRALLSEVAAEVTVGHVGSMASEYVQQGIPFLRSLNVEPFRINIEEVKFISNEFHTRLRKSALRPGDVVIVRTGKPGTCAVVPEWLEAANCSDLVIVRCGPNLLPKYLAYWVNSLAAHHVGSNTVGAVQQHFNVGAAKQMPLLLPSLGEQELILSVLAALDDKIELNRRMNETLEAMAQAIFRDWFVDFGPVRRKLAGATDPVEIMGGVTADPARAAELARLFPDQLDELGPNGWVGTTVGSVARRIATGPFGSRIKKENFVTEGVPVIRGANLAHGFVDRGFVFLTEEKGRELAGSRAEPEDIVFTHRGTLGQLGRIHPYSNYKYYIASQSQIVLSVDTAKIGPLFMYWFLRSDAGLNAWLSNAGGAGVPAIARPTDSLRRIEFLHPGRALTFEFDKLVRSLEARSVASQKETSLLAETRDYLLPRLMSGEVRVGEAAERVEDAA
jgi:type I restriction enzyme S subunit